MAIATYRSQTERTGELVLANDRIATMTRALYRSGLSDYLDVIDAERSLYQSQMSHVNLVAQQYINYVTLCKALGGGWTETNIPTNGDCASRCKIVSLEPKMQSENASIRT